MQKLILSAIVITFAMISGCGDMFKEDIQCHDDDQWCYLYCAKYLESGDIDESYAWVESVKQDYPKCGWVDQAFNSINHNDNLDLYTKKHPTTEDVKELLRDTGNRVAITYGTNRYHSIILVGIVVKDGADIVVGVDLTHHNRPIQIDLDSLEILYVDVAYNAKDIP